MFRKSETALTPCKNITLEIDPLEWPRLSGTLYYGLPHPWKLMDAAESIEIVPAETPRGMMACFAVLGLAAGAGVLAFLFCTPSFPEKWIPAVIGAGVALGLAILIPAIAAAGFARAQSRGPTLVISFLKKEVSLPREGKTWPFDRILRLEIVYGSWVRGSCGKPYLFSDRIGELQMVVASDDGKESAWSIVGNQWPIFGAHATALFAAATVIATRMKLPMAVIEVEGPHWPIPPKEYRDKSAK